MKVENIGSNRTEITTSKYKILVSYSTPVAAFDFDKLEFYMTSQYWSITTSKHINQWLDNNRMGSWSRLPVIEKEQAFIDDLLEN